MKDIIEIFKLADIKSKQVFTLLLLTVLLSFFESMGLGLLLPILEFIEKGDKIWINSSSKIWKIINFIVENLHMPQNLITLLVLAFIPIIIRQIFFYMKTVYVVNLQQSVVRDIRQSACDSIFKANVSFFSEKGVGDVSSMLTVEASRGGNAVLYCIEMITVIIISMFYVFILLLISYKLTIICLILFSFSGALIKKQIINAREIGIKISRLNIDFFKNINEKISAIRLIKLKGMDSEESKRVKDFVKGLFKSFLNLEILKAKINVITEPFLLLSVFLVLYFAVTFLDLTLATMGLFIYVTNRLVALVKKYNLHRHKIGSSISGLREVIKYIEKTNEYNTIKTGHLSFERFKKNIFFKDVWFNYYDTSHNNVWALKKLNFSIMKGEKTAIVGRSGAGKSTLANLIPRLYDATRGDILFDDVPIKNFELKSLRKKIGFVTQDINLFNDTIYNNITYGLDGNISRETVIKAAKMSFADNFINELPQRYETIIGERGIKLSGGQKQRIALCRVILQQAEVMILDEPTSSLDSESEKYIQEALDKIAKETTLITIAHRLSTIIDADKIIVLDQGRVVEHGTHQELLKKHGFYYNLFRLQTFEV